jgi:hypothetical protein
MNAACRQLAALDVEVLPSTAQSPLRAGWTRDVRQFYTVVASATQRGEVLLACSLPAG